MDSGAGFRRAGVGDIDALVALVESAYRGDASRAGWTTEADLLAGQRIDATMMAATLSDPAVEVLVRLDDVADDGIVGCCELRRLGGGVVSFGMFAVRPERQAAGAGRELLVEAERLVRAEWAATTMTMTVIEQRLELIDWYRRRGYEPTGEVRSFPYGDPRFGRPLRDDLRFVVLARSLA